MNSNSCPNPFYRLLLHLRCMGERFPSFYRLNLSGINLIKHPGVLPAIMVIFNILSSCNPKLATTLAI